MHISRGGVAAIITAAALVTAVACSSLPEAPGPATSHSPTVSISAASSSPLDFSRLNGQVPEPRSILLAPSAGTPIDATDYIASIFKSQHEFWEKYITARNFEMPPEGLDLASFGDVSTSPCHTGPINKDYPAIAYCSVDGHIIIPMMLLVRQWSDDSRKAGDLAVAITVSRSAANSVIDALPAQLKVAAPTPTAKLYLGSCLSGVWAHNVYPQDTFTNKDLATALGSASAIPYELNGTKAMADTDILTAAWISGFRSGRPANCMTSFWTRTA